jgi:hypothetical protein
MNRLILTVICNEFEKARGALHLGANLAFYTAAWLLHQQLKNKT